MEAKVGKQTIIIFDLQFSYEHVQQAWQDLKYCDITHLQVFF